MRFETTLRSIRASIARFPQHFAVGRGRQPALVRFPHALAAVEFLEQLSTAHEERRYVLVALVTEHRRGHDPLWQAMLITAFAPLLLAVRRSLLCPRDEDLDQRVFLAFLEALASSTYCREIPVFSLQRAMFNALERIECRESSEDRLTPEGDVPEVERYTIEGELDVRHAMQILPTIPGVDDEMIAVVRATILGDASIEDYVAHAYPGLDKNQAAAVRRRIRRDRAVVVEHLNTRLYGARVVPVES